MKKFTKIATVCDDGEVKREIKSPDYYKRTAAMETNTSPIF